MACSRARIPSRPPGAIGVGGGWGGQSSAGPGAMWLIVPRPIVGPRALWNCSVPAAQPAPGGPSAPPAPTGPAARRPSPCPGGAGGAAQSPVAGWVGGKLEHGVGPADERSEVLLPRRRAGLYARNGSHVRQTQNCPCEHFSESVHNFIRSPLPRRRAGGPRPAGRKAGGRPGPGNPRTGRGPPGPPGRRLRNSDASPSQTGVRAGLARFAGSQGPGGRLHPRDGSLPPCVPLYAPPPCGIPLTGAVKGSRRPFETRGAVVCVRVCVCVVVVG